MTTRDNDKEEKFISWLKDEMSTIPIPQQQVKQGGIMQLTEQQINQRIERMNIIQQSVKAGTYNDPYQPWNKVSRWIEDGNGDLKQ